VALEQSGQGVDRHLSPSLAAGASNQVELCSATCARIKADASSKVRFMFGCSVDDVIPAK
jgi:hypothetical protein